MADDLVTDVEGLRLIAWSLEGGNVKMADECRRAADEIERLRAERDMLADALTAQVSPDLSAKTARLLFRNAIAELEARHGWEARRG